MRFKTFIAEFERRGEIERRGIIHPHETERDDDSDIDNPDEAAKLDLLDTEAGNIHHGEEEDEI